MGGFLSIFAPPSAPAPAPLPPQSPPDDSQEVERRRRIEILSRRRRGRAETIATSLTGLLRLAADAPQRKSLLGE